MSAVPDGCPLSYRSPLERPQKCPCYYQQNCKIKKLGSNPSNCSVDVLKVFEGYIKRCSCYDNQLSSTVTLFRRTVVNPVIEIVKDMEKKESEQRR